MRIQLILKFKDSLVLPIQYNNILQAIILGWLGDENYQKFVHDSGYEFNNRRYKMYSFSRIEGKFIMNKEEKTITYFNEGKISISSVDDKFLNYIVNNVLLKSDFYMKGQKVYIDEVRCSKRLILSGDKIYTKSPIVVYSTFEHEGSKKTYYYSPMEKEFQSILKNNLINKYNAVYNKEPEDKNFEIQPLKNGKLRQSVVLYKKTVIKGWNGEFILKGSKELLDIAYNAGLGSKNAQGFGFIEISSGR